MRREEKTHLLETMTAALADSPPSQQKGEKSSVQLTCDVWWRPEFSAVRWIPQSTGLSVFNSAVQTMYIQCVRAGYTCSKSVTSEPALASLASWCNLVALTKFSEITQ